MNLEILNPLRWNKSFLILFITGFVIIWITFIDVYSLKTRWELNQKKKELKAKTEQLAHDSEILLQDLNSLEDNPALLEKIARERYGMRKPGETVYKIKTKD